MLNSFDVIEDSLLKKSSEKCAEVVDFFTLNVGSHLKNTEFRATSTTIHLILVRQCNNLNGFIIYI